MVTIVRVGEEFIATTDLPKVNRYCYKLKIIDDLCLVHVIWSERRMSKLVLNLKYLLLLSFLTAANFYNLGHIQGIVRVH